MNDWTKIEPNHIKGQSGFVRKEEKHNKTIALRLTEAQYKLIKRIASDQDQTAANIIRQALYSFFTDKGYDLNSLERTKDPHQRTLTQEIEEMT